MNYGNMKVYSTILNKYENKLEIILVVSKFGFGDFCLIRPRVWYVIRAKNAENIRC